MRARIPTTLGIATAIFCLLSVGIAFGGSMERRAMLGNAKMDVTDAMEAALKRFPGEVVKVMLDEKRGKEVFLVEVVGKGGEIREYFFNARSGKLLKEETLLEAGENTPGGRESPYDEP